MVSIIFVKHVQFRNGGHFKIDPPIFFLEHLIFFSSTLSFFCSIPDLFSIALDLFDVALYLFFIAFFHNFRATPKSPVYALNTNFKKFHISGRLGSIWTCNTSISLRIECFPYKKKFEKLFFHYKGPFGAYKQDCPLKFFGEFSGIFFFKRKNSVTKVLK